MKRIVSGIFLLMLLIIGCSDNIVNPQLSEFEDEDYALIKIDYSLLSKFREVLYNTHNPEVCDSNGVILFSHQGGLYYHPVQIGWNCLNALSDFRVTGNQEYLDHVIMSAETILSKAIRYKSGLYFPYYFEFVYDSPQTTMVPTWYCGMGQGLMLSVFSRLYYVTQNEAYKAVADSVLYSLTDFTSQYSTVFKTQANNLKVKSGYYWIDEYPHDIKTFVLNGFMTASSGLYDHWWVFGDEQSRKLYSMAATTIKHHVPLYRVRSGISYYDLYYKRQWPDYHTYHITLLNNCYKQTGDEFFAMARDLFYVDFNQD